MPSVALMSFFLLSACTKDQSGDMMQVTTDSDLARELYKKSQLAFDQIDFKLSFHNLELAVGEDPNFFMAHFWMYFMSESRAKEVAEKALQTEIDLNDAEQQIKAAFKYLLDGQEDKAVMHLQKAVDLYPSDPHLHKILYILQYHLLKDYEGAIESINRAIKEVPDYPLAYNQLGYACMELDRYDEARKAFDSYIRLAPELANPYDSEGDYYMNTGQYDKAYESYMKAYKIDPEFSISEKKAKKALQLKKHDGDKDN